MKLNLPLKAVAEAGWPGGWWFPDITEACAWLCRPFRGHARSHRYSASLRACAVPVGAGKPAKRP
ncbi:hypothetical protein DMX12_27580 [Pseudomonas sp. MB-090624]|nr:hypothetical protein DMX12_27580 [Pseudomonas sp. MB-090624]